MDDRRLADPDDAPPDGTDHSTGTVLKGPVAALGRSKLHRLFVLQVVVWNAVLLLFSVGGLLIYFEGDWTTGGQLVALAALLGIYGVYRWPDRDVEE